MRKVPMRSCIMCREKKEKRSLLRIVRDEKGQVVFDPTGKLNGRGAYLCDKKECVDGVLVKAKIDKVLEINANEQDLQKAHSQIVKYLGEYRNKEDK